MSCHYVDWCWIKDFFAESFVFFSILALIKVLSHIHTYLHSLLLCPVVLLSINVDINRLMCGIFYYCVRQPNSITVEQDVGTQQRRQHQVDKSRNECSCRTRTQKLIKSNDNLPQKDLSWHTFLGKSAILFLLLGMQKFEWLIVISDLLKEN